VEALGHVVNFDVPTAPEDYIHRVGRTGRAEATGDAFTFAAPDEQDELRAIERAVGAKLPRVTVPGFDYQRKPEARFEIPIAERIAAIRARKAEERARAKAKAERRAQQGTGAAPRSGTGSPGPAGAPSSRPGSTGPRRRPGGGGRPGGSGRSGGRPGGPGGRER
jgi:ATP-dependent RNA helicase RhlE